MKLAERETQARPIQFGSWVDAERALRRGGIPMWLTSAVFAKDRAGSEPGLEITGPALFWDRCGVATRKGEDDLIALLDHAVRALEDDGTTQTLIDTWFGEEDPGIRQ